MPKSRTHWQGSRLAVLAADAQGRVSWLGGDPCLVRRLKNRWGLLGVSWQEAELGTNAIGTSLATGQLVTIEGDEHYCALGKQWTCHAVPVRDAFDNRIVGILDVTHEAGAHSARARRELLQLARSLEADIEARLTQEHALITRRFEEMRDNGRGRLAFDRAGRVVCARADLASLGLSIGSTVPFLHGLRLNEEAHRPLDLHSPLGEVDRFEDGAGGVVHLTETQSRPQRSAKPSALGPPLAQMAKSSPSLTPTLLSAQHYLERKINIVLQGESGIGKEVLARRLHAATSAPEAPFVRIDCALLSQEVGGEISPAALAGASLGLLRSSLGRRGVLFLDSVADLNGPLQRYLAGLLAGCEADELQAGARQRTRATVICASDRSLTSLAGAGRFRLDLLHQLSGAVLELPPLRHRLSDIPTLIDALLVEIRPPGDPPVTLTDAVLRKLHEHSWPGNLRELRNVLLCMLASSAGGTLECADLPGGFAREPLLQHPAEGRRAQVTSLRTLERESILAAMQLAGGSATAAARALGISRATIYRKLATFSRLPMQRITSASTTD